MSFSTMLLAMVAAAVRLPVSRAEFPVHVKLEDWSWDDPDVRQYIEELIVKTGGVGIGCAFLFALIIFPMFFCFWCPCCKRPETDRACCGIVSSKPPGKFEKWIVVLILVQCLAAVVCCAIAMGVTAQDALDDVEGVFASSGDSVRRGEGWICGGEVVAAIDGQKGVTAARIASMVQADPSLQCAEGSVEGYVRSIWIRFRDLLLSLVEFLENLSPIIEQTKSSVDAVEDFHIATGMMVTAGEQLQAGTQNMKTALANLNTLKDTNTINLVFPDAQYIPEVTDEDVDSLRAAQTSAGSALADMRDTYNTVNETISSLQTETIDEIMSQLADVNKSVVTLQHDIYDFLVDSNKAKMDIDDMKDDSQTQNQTIIAVIASLCAAFVPFLCCSTLGSMLRNSGERDKRQPSKHLMRCCSCCTYLTVFWVTFLAGFVLLLYYILSDSCDYMLEGNAKSNGQGIVQMNVASSAKIGNTTVKVGEFITDVLQCPVGCKLQNGTSEGCTEDNTLFTLMGIQREFNFTKNVDKPVADLRQSVAEFSDVPLDSALTAINSPEIQDALSYNFTQEWDSTYYTVALDTAIQALPNLQYSQSSSEDEKWRLVYEVAAPPNSENLQLNRDVTSELSAASAAAQQIETGLQTTTQAQTRMSNAVTDVTNSINAVNSEIDIIKVSLDKNIDMMYSLVNFIYDGAAGVLRCGWIGEIYEDVIENGMCAVFDNFYALGAIVGLCCAELYLSIVIIVPTTRWVMGSVDNDDQEATPEGKVHA